MQIEYEATFTDIHKDEVRRRFAAAGALLVKPEFLQKRAVFLLPSGHEITGGWLRVRDEGNRITMSLKVVDGTTISDQKELCLIVNSFEDACHLLESMGSTKKAYQESKRELWVFDEVEITIDEWPFLEPFVEVEGKDETAVRQVADALGFDWSRAQFCSVATLYSEKYGTSEQVINNETPLLLFDMKNPFV